MGAKKKSKKAPHEGSTSTDTLTPHPTALTAVVAAYQAFTSVLGKDEPGGKTARLEAARGVEKALELQPSGAGCYLLVCILPGTVAHAHPWLHCTALLYSAHDCRENRAFSWEEGVNALKCKARSSTAKQ